MSTPLEEGRWHALPFLAILHLRLSKYTQGIIHHHSGSILRGHFCHGVTCGWLTPGCLGELFPSPEVRYFLRLRASTWAWKLTLAS